MLLKGGAKLGDGGETATNPFIRIIPRSMKHGAADNLQPRGDKPSRILQRGPEKKHHPCLTLPLLIPPTLRKHIENCDRSGDKTKGSVKPCDILVEVKCDDLRGENARFGEDGYDLFVGRAPVLQRAPVEHGKADEGAGKFGGCVGNGIPEVIEEVRVIGAGRAGGGVVGERIVTAMVSRHGEAEDGVGTIQNAQ